jgi:iron complex transport system ATP-binding protein
MSEIKLDNTFSITGPDHVFIIGNNGSGKSTFLKSFVAPSSLYKIELSDQKMAYLPQNFEHFDELTSVEFFEFMEVDLGHEYLNYFDITKLLNRRMNAMSGGEKQRVYLAGVMAQKVDVYLFDEPLNNLDLFWQIQFLKLANTLSKSKLVLTICHDLNVLQKYSKKIIVFTSMKYQIYSIEQLMNAKMLEEIFKVKFREVDSQFVVNYV